MGSAVATAAPVHQIEWSETTHTAGSANSVRRNTNTVSGIMHAYIGVPNFDYIACHSQDVMHNEYVAGGHASKEASRMCSDMFKSVQGSVRHHQLTHKQFNILLADYNYYSARERLNRPSKQKLRAFESDGHLLWTAAEMKVFVFHSERIIGGWVDKTDPAWACWLKHVKYLKLLDLDEIPDEDVNHIQGCISDQSATSTARLFHKRHINFVWAQ